MIAALLAAVLTFYHAVVIPPPEPPRIEVRMAVTFDQFMAAIAGQESGGLKNPYSVVNAYGAVGKYQVLKSNVPEWSRAALGYSITWQQFRDSPDLQEKIVRHRMKGYFDKYGARGAASAWYSGNPKLHMSTRSQAGGPSIKSYVDSVMSRAAKMPSSNGGTEIGEAASGSRSTPAGRTELAENYGFVEQLFAGVPELKRLFDKAVKETWTPAKFQSEIRGTEWWKTTTETERQYLTKLYGDPASARTILSNNRVKVWSLAAQLGATPSEFLANKLIYGMSAYGWTDARLRTELVKSIELGDTPAGEAGEVVAQLKEYGWVMGVTVSSDWAMDQAKNVVGAGYKVEDSKAYIRKLAKGQFANWARQIDAGQTVQDLASPYLQSMSQILELPPGSISLWNPTIKNALQAKNPSTGELEVKQLWQFENELRADERWKKTKNAQDSTMQVAHQVLADFGFKT